MYCINVIYSLRIEKNFSQKNYFDKNIAFELSITNVNKKKNIRKNTHITKILIYCLTNNTQASPNNEKFNKSIINTAKN